MYLLGIDGGGTKTEEVVADAYGNVFAKVVTGSSNPTSMSREDFESIMEKAHFFDANTEIRIV
ncbi:hypothetical protein [Psychrobacillus lasiicapitis]|uniref:hypothetical protein n=1 Tax=Psychrobacillus lasiicapitis TaxID=1636719 RepID=UPI001476FC5E|nr:hypothetical protein [Psychrobacillus lasiicapitis]GGA33246.1 hypothetical protein GCM10011384_23570 [Psychrobacillus lasiicapitis]